MRSQAPSGLKRAEPRPALGMLPIIHGQFDLAELAAQREVPPPSSPQGENLAGLIGELLQTFLQPLPRPFAAFGGHFTFGVGQTGEGLGSWFHKETRLAGLLVCVDVRNRYPPVFPKS